MTDTSPTLAWTLEQVWQLLVRGVADRRAPARHPVLATVDPAGGPQARTVVLRGASRASASVEIHTDRLSRKMTDLAANPRAALHVWAPGPAVQLRLSGPVEIATGDAATPRWHRVPDASRVAYGHVPPPGTAIAASDAWADAPGPHRFAVLTIHLDWIEHVSLDPTGHRRAEFRRAESWEGRWLSP